MLASCGRTCGVFWVAAEPPTDPPGAAIRTEPGRGATGPSILAAAEGVPATDESATILTTTSQRKPRIGLVAVVWGAHSLEHDASRSATSPEPVDCRRRAGAQPSRGGGSKPDQARRPGSNC